MVIKINERCFEVLKNAKDALNIEELKEHYIEEMFDKYPYIVGDIADNKLRLKGFSTNNQDKNFYHTIPDYILESCPYQAKHFILKGISEDEYNSRKGEPLSSEALVFEDRSVKIEKTPFDKETLNLEKTEKSEVKIFIDTNKMNQIPRFELPQDLKQEIQREKQQELRNSKNNKNNNKNKNHGGNNHNKNQRKN